MRAFDGLAEDTLWSAVVDVLAVAITLVSFILITRVWSKEEYGLFVGLYALATAFSAITYSGPGLALLQRRFRFNQDLDEIKSAFLSLTIIGGVVGTTLAVGLASRWIDLSFTEILFVTASELIANSIIWVCSWLVQISVSFPAMMRVRIFAALLKLVGLLALYFTDTLTIQNLGLAYLLLYGAFALWLMFSYLPRIGYRSRLRRPPSDAIRTSTVFAVPLAARQIQTGGDLVALDAYKLEADAGVYGAAYRVVLLGMMPLRIIETAAFHRFLPDGAEEDRGYHLRRSAQLTAFMFVVGVAAAAAIYGSLILAEPIVDLVIPEEFAEAKEIIPWLVLFLPLLAISGTPMNGLLGLGRAKERAVVFMSSAVFSVFLYVTLIPTNGWQGAVAATLISEAYLAIVSWIAMIYYQRRSDSDQRDSAAATDHPV